MGKRKKNVESESESSDSSDSYSDDESSSDASSSSSASSAKAVRKKKKLSSVGSGLSGLSGAKKKREKDDNDEWGTGSAVAVRSDVSGATTASKKKSVRAASTAATSTLAPLSTAASASTRAGPKNTLIVPLADANRSDVESQVERNARKERKRAASTVASSALPIQKIDKQDAAADAFHAERSGGGWSVWSSIIDAKKKEKNSVLGMTARLGKAFKEVYAFVLGAVVLVFLVLVLLQPGFILKARTSRYATPPVDFVRACIFALLAGVFTLLLISRIKAHKEKSVGT